MDPHRRGLLGPALTLSTVGLVVCAASWAALITAVLHDPDVLSDALRLAPQVLVTGTLGCLMVNVVGRLVRVARRRAVAAEAVRDDVAEIREAIRSDMDRALHWLLRHDRQYASALRRTSDE